MLSPMHPAQAHRRRGWGSALAVAAVHALLGLAMLASRPPPDRSNLPAQPALLVWLLPAEVASAQRPAARTEPPSTPVAPLAGTPPRPAPVPVQRPVAAQAITLPAASAPQPTLAEAPAAAAPLQLDLPRTASAPERRRHPGLDDPRANTPRKTLEARIAGTMGGDDRLVEEMLGDGRLRYRQGADCILVQPSRAALVDPFNQSATPIPRMVGPC
jgi:hypothetical protein